MKSTRIIYGVIAILVIMTGCGTVPSYRGDGHIKNNSYFMDATIFGHTTLYTIRLESFDMSTNIQKEFDLGELSHFREAIITVCIRFKDGHSWDHFTKLNAQELKIAAKYDWRDLDSLKSSFGYRLSNQSGTLLTQPETLFKNYTWGGGQIDSEIGREIEVRNSDQARTQVPAGSKLKLWVSYTGDSALTNRADFVVFWQWH